jgi:hypothetical protein
MPTITQTRETGDLTVLTIKRVRAAMLLASQLIEDDDQRASMFIAVAVDLINASAQMLEHDGQVAPRSAMMMVIASVLYAVDDPQIRSVIETVLGKRTQKP